MASLTEFRTLWSGARAVPCHSRLICNCQLAVRSDSSIDSLLLLLIFVLIVAFCVTLLLHWVICGRKREFNSRIHTGVSDELAISGGSWSQTEVNWIQGYRVLLVQPSLIQIETLLEMPSNIPSIVCPVICEISHKQSIHFPIIYWCLCVVHPHCNMEIQQSPAINLQDALAPAPGHPSA